MIFSYLSISPSKFVDQYVIWSILNAWLSIFALFWQLRAFMTEPMLDQIPMLGEMQRYLEHLSMMEPPPPKKEVILEQVKFLLYR